MPRLRQVTIAIIGLGVMLLGMGITAAALGLSVAEGLRDDIRAVGAEPEAMRMEARADREAMLAEGRAFRAAIQRQMERFQRQMQEYRKRIPKPTERQGVSNGPVDGPRRDAESDPAP